jgi:cytochrome P450
MIEMEKLTDPERKLWASVLLQAITDLRGQDFAARSARAWFASTDNTEGSLTWICHHLSLDPDAVRLRVLRDARQKQRDSRTNQTTNRAA